MYTLDAIILDIQSIRDKQVRLVLFTREYGKISAWIYKNISGVDIGDIAHVVIERRESINRIRHIESRYFIGKKRWTYAPLISFLEILKTLYHHTSDEDIHMHIFDDYLVLLQDVTACTEEDHSLLVQTRFLKMLGSLDPQFFHASRVLQYIYNTISTTPLERILASRALHEEEKKILRAAHLHAQSQLT